MTRTSYMRMAATGTCLPKDRVSNQDLKARFQLDTSDEWIVERSGIRFRRLAGAGESTVAMASASAQQALTEAGWQGSDLDLLICATCTPDRALPSTAAEVHRELGCASHCPAFDVGAACSGFIYALSLADSMMYAQPQINKVLVVCAERMSSIVDWSDRSTAVLFGDGAGAVLFERAAEPGHYHSRLYTAGKFSDLLYTPDKDGKIKMQGKAVFRQAVAMMEELVDTMLESTDFCFADIDRLVPHQANSRIINTLAKKLGLSDDQVVMNIDELGNTSAASIPIALDHGLRSGQIKAGQLLLLEAFGAGFVWGGSLLRC